MKERFYIDPDVVRFLSNSDALSTEITIWRHGGNIWHPQERKISGDAIPCDIVAGVHLQLALQSLSEKAIGEVEE